jgi:hypothetical protein
MAELTKEMLKKCGAVIEARELQYFRLLQGHPIGTETIWKKILQHLSTSSQYLIRFFMTNINIFMVGMTTRPWQQSENPTQRKEKERKKMMQNTRFSVLLLVNKNAQLQ